MISFPMDLKFPMDPESKCVVACAPSYWCLFSSCIMSVHSVCWSEYMWALYFLCLVRSAEQSSMGAAPEIGGGLRFCLNGG